MKKIGFICVLCALNWTCLMKKNLPDTPPFDWQGHRGARGILPENTIPSMLEALRYPQIRTLELDLVVSRDGQLVVSHEPWFNPEICTQPNGDSIPKGKKINLFELNYAQIRQFDCGKKGNSRFPEQRPMATYKPTLRELVDSVRQFCQKNNRQMPRFNLEIKAEPSYDGIFSPFIENFVQLVFDEIKNLEIIEICTVQSFDIRACEIAHQLNTGSKKAKIAILVEHTGGVDFHLQKLNFKPDIYSCYFKLLKKKDIKLLQERGIKVVPWTVNEVEDMKKLIRWKVDGIITDYPNRIELALKN